MKSYKGYKEMTRCVLEARDEYLRKKKKRQLYFKRSVPAVLSFCFIAVLLSFNHGKVSMPRIPDETQISDISTITSEVTETETTQPTTATSTSKVKTAITTTIKTTITHEKETKIPETTINTSTITAEVAEPETIQPITAASTSKVKTAITTTILHEKETKISETTVNTATQDTENNITTVQTTIQPDTKETTTEELDGAPPVTTSDKVTDGTPNNETPLPWDERNLGQKYFFAEFGSVTESYSTANKTVSDIDIGDYIADAYMSGYDDETQTYYHCYAKAYLIKDKTEKEMIAIHFEEGNEYYVYSYNQLSE